MIFSLEEIPAPKRDIYNIMSNLNREAQKKIVLRADRDLLETMMRFDQERLDVTVSVSEMTVRATLEHLEDFLQWLGERTDSIRFDPHEKSRYKAERHVRVLRGALAEQS